MSQSNDLAQEKRDARERARKRRAEAHERFSGSAPDALADRFVERFGDAPAEWLSGYWPIRTEIDPRALLQRLHDAGVSIGLPVVVGPAAPLVFRRWQPESTLDDDPFGIPSPTGEAAEIRPEILLIPLLAFDRSGFRLGYGGGFYDRTLQRLRQTSAEHGPVRTIGVAYADQEVDRVPRGANDQPIDAVLTERGLFEFQTE